MDVILTYKGEKYIIETKVNRYDDGSRIIEEGVYQLSGKYLVTEDVQEGPQGADLQHRPAKMQHNRAGLQLWGAKLRVRPAKLQPGGAGSQLKAANMQYEGAKLQDKGARMQGKGANLQFGAANLQVSNEKLRFEKAGMQFPGAKMTPEIV